MLFESKVTAPFCARRRPSTVAPVVTVMDIAATRTPTKVVVVPSVAEEPTCQKTLHGNAPSTKVMVAAEAVVRVEPILKIKSVVELLDPLRMSVPVSAALLLKT